MNLELSCPNDHEQFHDKMLNFQLSINIVKFRVNHRPIKGFQLISSMLCIPKARKSQAIDLFPKKKFPFVLDEINAFNGIVK